MYMHNNEKADKVTMLLKQCTRKTSSTVCSLNDRPSNFKLSSITRRMKPEKFSGFDLNGYKIHVSNV